MNHIVLNYVKKVTKREFLQMFCSIFDNGLVEWSIINATGSVDTSKAIDKGSFLKCRDVCSSCGTQFKCNFGNFVETEESIRKCYISTCFS